MAKKLKIEKSERKQNIFDEYGNFSDKELLNDTHIEIFGNKIAVLEGCKGVGEYNDVYLKLRIKKGEIILYGTDFDIVSFENETITLRGKIGSIEFVL